MFSLKNFRSYQMSLLLYRECEKIKVRSHLKDQLLRASLSVPLNLSEGSAKESVKDRKRYYGIALASLRETQTLLEIVRASAEVRALADRAGASLYRLVHAASRPVPPDLSPDPVTGPVPVLPGPVPAARRRLPVPES